MMGRWVELSVVLFISFGIVHDWFWSILIKQAFRNSAMSFLSFRRIYFLRNLLRESGVKSGESKRGINDFEHLHRFITISPHFSTKRGHRDSSTSLIWCGFFWPAWPQTWHLKNQSKSEMIFLSKKFMVPSTFPWSFTSAFFFQKASPQDFLGIIFWSFGGSDSPSRLSERPRKFWVIPVQVLFPSGTLRGFCRCLYL